MNYFSSFITRKNNSTTHADNDYGTLSNNRSSTPHSNISKIYYSELPSITEQSFASSLPEQYPNNSKYNGLIVQK